MSALLAQLTELHREWTGWLIGASGAGAQRVGGGYQIEGFGEAAWLRFRIHHQLRSTGRAEPVSGAAPPPRPRSAGAPPTGAAPQSASQPAYRQPPMLPKPPATAVPPPGHAARPFVAKQHAVVHGTHRAPPLPPQVTRDYLRKLHPRVPATSKSALRAASPITIAPTFAAPHHRPPPRRERGAATHRPAPRRAV